MLRILALAAIGLTLPTVAWADRAEADACAAKLTGQSRVAYRAVVQRVEAGSTLENAVRDALKPKVDSGRVSEADARVQGREAANCARLVHRKG